MMKHLAVYCYCILFIPSTAVAGIPEIRHMSQNSNGSFNVTCLDGRSEMVNAKIIAKNLVCKTGKEISFQSKPVNHSAVTCTGNEFMDWFYITRISDEVKLGDKLSSRVCQELVNAGNYEIVCTGNEFMDWFYITRISDGKKLGERISLATCLKLSSRN